MRILERLLLLRSIDVPWVNHLTSMENLRTGIGLHAYGQKRSPFVVYRTEGHKTFQELLDRMQTDVVNSLFHVTTTDPAAPAGKRRAKSTPQQTPMKQFQGSQNFGSTGKKSAGTFLAPVAAEKNTNVVVVKDIKTFYRISSKAPIVSDPCLLE
ncbi:MAG: hypothetical protein Ct9H300mP27_01080 [Chloroflexota bacterium]|nr:MAG: hypothetical protein Ct9H300mP27_01080 [Chloroflexota bacterium]